LVNPPTSFWSCNFQGTVCFPFDLSSCSPSRLFPSLPPFSLSRPVKHHTAFWAVRRGLGRDLWLHPLDFSKWPPFGPCSFPRRWRDLHLWFGNTFPEFPCPSLFSRPHARSFHFCCCPESTGELRSRRTTPPTPGVPSSFSLPHPPKVRTANDAQAPLAPAQIAAAPFPFPPIAAPSFESSQCRSSNTGSEAPLCLFAPADPRILSFPDSFFRISLGKAIPLP